MNIYLVENRATTRRYIGASIANKTVYRHRLIGDAKRHGPEEDGTLLGDIFKHGIDNVTITFVEACERETVNERRRYWVEYFSTATPQGYNYARWREEAK